MLTSCTGGRCATSHPALLASSAVSSGTRPRRSTSRLRMGTMKQAAELQEKRRRDAHMSLTAQEQRPACDDCSGMVLGRNSPPALTWP